MPTTYTTTVTVDGYATANYGSQLDSLEIVSGATNRYELAQPATGRASFLGLPVVSGITQTPDWWIGKKLTFTIDPDGSTGSTTWVANCVGVVASVVDPAGTQQIVELELQSPTSKLSMETIQNPILSSQWANLYTFLNEELQRLTWDEAPWGLTWAGATGTWATWDANKSGCTFAMSGETAGVFYSDINLSGMTVLDWLTTVFSTKKQGAIAFQDSTVTIGMNTSTTSAFTLDALTCVIANSMSVAPSQSDVINSGKITDTSGTDYFYGNATSVASYGYRPYDAGTSWDTLANLQSVLQKKINGFKDPNRYLASFTIDLDKVSHANTWWPSLYKMEGYPYPFTLTNVPTFMGGNHTYQVRGIQLNLTNKHAEATLVVVPSTIWNA